MVPIGIVRRNLVRKRMHMRTRKGSKGLQLCMRADRSKSGALIYMIVCWFNLMLHKYL